MGQAMSRLIRVSTHVFAAMWANREEGEETEDAILRRVFGCPKADDAAIVGPTKDEIGGFHDTRNHVHFPQGFEIFRTYKRQEYKAVAMDGAWLRTDTGKLYSSLNQLNVTITESPDSVWNGSWKYRTEDGVIRSIRELRR